MVTCLTFLSLDVTFPNILLLLGLQFEIDYKHMIVLANVVLTFLVYVSCALIELRLGTPYSSIVLLTRLSGRTCSCGK